MPRTTPSRPIDIERVFSDLAVYRRTTARLHSRPGTSGPHDSSVGGSLLWLADEPWPVCTERHRRGYRERTADVRLRRRILAEAWSRVPAPGQCPGPTDEEGEVLRSFKRGAPCSLSQGHGPHPPGRRRSEDLSGLILVQIAGVVVEFVDRDRTEAVAASG